jgi:hypothetical protein
MLQVFGHFSSRGGALEESVYDGAQFSGLRPEVRRRADGWCRRGSDRRHQKCGASDDRTQAE